MCRGFLKKKKKTKLLNIKLDTLRGLVILDGKPLTDKEKIKVVLQSFIVDHVSNGGSLSELSLGAGNIPSILDVFQWEENDEEFRHKLRVAQGKRIKITTEQYFKALNEYLESGTTADKDKTAALDKILHSLKKMEGNDNTPINLTVYKEFKDDIFDTAGVGPLE